MKTFKLGKHNNIFKKNEGFRLSFGPLVDSCPGDYNIGKVRLTCSKDVNSDGFFFPKKDPIAEWILDRKEPCRLTPADFREKVPSCLKLRFPWLCREIFEQIECVWPSTVESLKRKSFYKRPSWQRVHHGVLELHDDTLWKYSCHGRVRHYYHWVGVRGSLDYLDIVDVLAPDGEEFFSEHRFIREEHNRTVIEILDRDPDEEWLGIFVDRVLKKISGNPLKKRIFKVFDEDTSIVEKRDKIAGLLEKVVY